MTPPAAVVPRVRVAGEAARLEGVEVPLTADQEAQLNQLASRQGKAPLELIQETVARLLDEDARFRAAVRRGVEQAERGELIDHKDVVERIERMFGA